MQSNVVSNRLFWRLTILPQIVLFFLLIIMLGCMCGYGIVSAISALQAHVTDLKNAVNLIVAAISTVVGVVVVRLFSKVTDLAKLFIFEERRFTSHLARINLAASDADLRTVADQYARK